MGGRILKKVACLDPTCGSSDARAIYENGTSYCFSCCQYFKATDEEKAEMAEEKPHESGFTKVHKLDVTDFPIRPITPRGISKEVAELYQVRTSFNASTGEADAHYYPYPGGAYKVRKLPKEFSWIGNTKELFGKDKFQSGGKRVIVTEGEIDCLSAAQASLDKYGKIYPVVSVPSASTLKPLIEAREWLRTFDEVILCFDNDEAGKAATEQAITIVGIDKAKIVKLPSDCKDANDVLLKHKSVKFMQCVYDAARHIPSGIMTKDQLWEALCSYSQKESIPYPPFLSGVNAKTKGMRTGEIALFVSGTSCGKSTVMREIALSVHEQTPVDTRIGLVSLEEAPAESARKLAGMALHRNPAKEEITIEELKPGFDKVFGEDRFVVLDHQGSLKDESILNKLEYMALSGCKHIIIDHITILVSEGAGDLQGNEAIDKIMNDLLRFVKKHDVWIGLVSHLRKTMKGKPFEEGEMPNLDDIKGSGSIKQISFDIIAFARNLLDPDEIARNTIKMAVLKCRYTGLTGPVEGAYYDYDTGRFKSIDAAAEKSISSANDFTTVKQTVVAPVEAAF